MTYEGWDDDDYMKIVYWMTIRSVSGNNGVNTWQRHDIIVTLCCGLNKPPTTIYSEQFSISHIEPSIRNKIVNIHSKIK